MKNKVKHSRNLFMLIYVYAYEIIRLWFYLFTGCLVFLALYLVLGVGQQLVCNIIGFVYPAYCSMKALESPNKDDDTKWLTYWVTFAAFTIIEFFSEYIICWFPVYWLMKVIIINSSSNSSSWFFFN